MGSNNQYEHQNTWKEDWIVFKDLNGKMLYFSKKSKWEREAKAMSDLQEQIERKLIYGK